MKNVTLLGVSLTMFLIFVGFSSGQFHSYLFESRGIKGLQIGLIIMAGQGLGILSPLFQVSIIRRFHGPRQPLMLMLGGAGAALAVLPHLRGFWPLLIGFCLFSFCGSGIFPLNAACTLEAMRNHGHGAYFRIRSLGTLGFLVGCVVSVFFPTLNDLPLLYGGFAAFLFFALAMVAWEYRFAPSAEAASVLPLGRTGGSPTFSAALGLLREPRTLRLLILLGVMNFANAMATGVQGNYLVDRWHQGQRTISMAWVVSTACEVPLMLLCAAVLRRFGLRYVIGLGILGTLLKLAGLAVAGEVWQYYLALTLHGCFFSGALTGFSVFLDRTYRKEERAALQALAPVFYAGIPASLAGLTAGLVWHAFSLRAVYLLSGGIAVAAAGYALVLLRNSGQSGDKNVL
ncbi:MAG: transporter [Fibrobacteres bacterium]|nr:transporter [Fibrobacterota bacterium]